MRVPTDFYNQLRLQLRISDIIKQKINLTKKGSEYLGNCPFHNEKTPSFTVNDQKRFYHCFGCHAHGDIIRFTAEIRGLSYSESAIVLAKENGIEIPKISREEQKIQDEADKIHDILELAKNFFISELTDITKEYLYNRGIDNKVIEKFAIGYAPGKGSLQKFFKAKSINNEDLLKAGLVGKDKNGRIYEIFNDRIIFPIINIYNKVVGFGGRIISGDNGPKYLNSPETLVFKKSQTMYGENFATSAAYKKNHFIVVEGYMDVIALNIAGFSQAVASLGTSVTDKHLEKLWRSCQDLVICLDGDNAGIRASQRLIDLAISQISPNKSISFMQLPDNLDPDDIIKKGGAELLNKLLNNKKSLSEMIWITEYQNKNFITAESRAALEKKLDEYSNQITDTALKNNIKRYFKDQIWENLIKHKPKNNTPYQTNNFTNFKFPYGPKNLPINTNILTMEEQSELQIIEQAIFDFILMFPEVIRDNFANQDFLQSTLFHHAKLNELIDWILDKVIENSHSDPISIESLKELAKNTSFYDRFLVESATNVIFLGVAFNNNSDNKMLFFDWLQKRYYLLLLQKEYIEISRNLTEDSESKYTLYLKEIKKVSEELKKLAAVFVN